MAAILIVLLLKFLKGRHHSTLLEAESTSIASPDISREEVLGDELPCDQWIDMAKDMAARGNLRLALRAFFLAAIAHLAHNRLIQVTRFKSNMDYVRELKQRVHVYPGIETAFSRLVSTFEQTWYGQYLINQDELNEFGSRINELRNNVEK
jgi:hypothetical protein